LWKLPEHFLAGASVSAIEFESPSRLIELELSIPYEFQGTQIQIPNSVRRVSLEITSLPNGPIVVDFGRDSRLAQFGCKGDWMHPVTRGVFARFSERTLKNGRGWEETPMRTGALPRTSR
jgi:hypothetical protein